MNKVLAVLMGLFGSLMIYFLVTKNQISNEFGYIIAGFILVTLLGWISYVIYSKIKK